MSASRLVWLGYTRLLPSLELKANCPISFLWTIRYKSISCLGYCVKVLGKRSCKKQGFLLAHSWKVQSIMVGKYWRQGQEAAGLVSSHLLSGYGERWTLMLSSWSLFIQSGPSAQGWCCLQWGWVFPPLVTHSRKASTDMPEVCSQVILSS